jgi:serine/threonine protein kinase
MISETAMHDLPADRDPLDALAEEFVGRYRRGENPSVEDYARRYPELADGVRELFPAATLLEDLKGPPAQAASVPVPERLGDYRIVRELGRGGMGVVYEAEQGSLGRRVALKVLPNYVRMAPEQLERFRREARAAGRLHHTNIVPVFGVGEHEGMPYYVMQLIAGRGLDRLLAKLRISQGRRPTRADSTHLAGKSGPADPTPPGLSAEAPLAPPAETDAAGVPLFGSPAYYRFVARLGAQVAEALAYAHRQGILHRDVKPANLLLDQTGAVWVTDFGLAKLLEHDDLTVPGEVAGTLRYSAPERFAGRSDARTDVYSLGLTLYELLTLRAAYDEPDPSRLLLQVTEGRIPTPRAFNAAVPRDLETVVLRCLAPEPENRYAAAQDLADDLRRYLDDRPVKARRTTVFEHGWRWCRRNPAVASLSASLLLVLLAGFAVVSWKWREAAVSAREAREALGREEDERHRAEGNLTVALEAFDRIARQLASGRPGVPLDSGEEAPSSPVVTPEVAAVLQDLVRFQDSFAQTNSNDPRLKRDTVRALRQVGTIRLRLNEHDEAVAALTRAAEILAAEPEQRVELAQTYNDLGVALRAAGKTPEALRSHAQAREILDAWPEPAPLRVRLELARTLTLMVPLELRQTGPGSTPEQRQAALALAEQTQRGALQLLDQLVEEDGANPECRHLLARATYGLSGMMWGRTRRDEAALARARALEIQEKLAADFPRVADYRAELAEMLLSTSWRSPQNPRPPQEVEPIFARAVGLVDELVAKNPAVPNYQALLARARRQLGGVQAAQGKDEEALTNLRKAMRLSDLLAGRFPNSLGYRLSGLDARLVLGEYYHRRDDLEAAEELLRGTVAELRKMVDAPPRPRFLRGMLSRHARALANTLHDAGDDAGAEEMNRLADEYAPPPPPKAPA